MIENVFTNAVCIKDWEGCQYEKRHSIRHLAIIPNTYIMVETLTSPEFFKPYSYLSEESKDIAHQIASMVAERELGGIGIAELSKYLSEGLAHEESRGHIIGEIEIRLIPIDFVSHTHDLRL